MARPTAAQNNDDKFGDPPDFKEPDSISPEHRVTDLEGMFGNKDEDSKDDGEDFGGDDGDVNNVPPQVDDDYDDDYRFDDREESNLAAEALRRARRTEEAVSEVFGTINDIKEMMQNGGSAATQTPSVDETFRFSNEDRELINEAMKTDPAGAMEILHGNLLKQAKQLAGNTAAANVAREAARQRAERDVASMFPAMRRKNSKFRRAVEQRTSEMRREYKSRGIDPDTMPELVKYAALDLASSEPELLGSANSSTRVNEDSRQRAADRVTKMSSSRGRKKSEDLPELTDKDIQRGRRMGLDMSDDKVRRSLQMRRRYYEKHRR